MFHEQIKTATTPEHKNAERHSYGQEIMSRTLTSEQYLQLLVANYAFISAWESQWDQLGFDVPEALHLDSRRKATLLEKDLKAFGIDPNSVDRANLDITTNYAQFMGRMYVIEGSTMGGAVIEKQLRLNENLSGHDFAFYGGYGSELMPKWRSFLAILNTITDSTQQAECIISAKQSFSEMEQCFIQAKASTSTL